MGIKLPLYLYNSWLSWIINKFTIQGCGYLYVIGPFSYMNISLYIVASSSSAELIG